MTTTKTTKIILTLLLLLVSVVLFLTYPTFGLYFSCMSTFVLCGLYINLKRPIKYSIAAATFVLTYVLLVEKATELQGQKLVCKIVDYYAANKKTPNSLNETNGLLINSFTPSFSKYQYSSTFDSVSTYIFYINYTDLWGKKYKYCDKCGEFECK
jgi:hypothetical protein